METGHQIFNALGMTVIHSLWQGAVLAALVMFALMIAGKSNARARYAIHFTGLLLLLASFILTFTVILRNNQALLKIREAMLVLPADNTIVQSLPISNSIAYKLLSLFAPYSNYLAILWIAGFFFTGVRMTGGAIIARISFRRGLEAPPLFLIDLFESIKQNMGLYSNIKLRISNRMISPFVTGIIEPMVIIPAAAVTGLSFDQLHSVIVHELAHIRRHDHILVLLQAFARLFLFFHPLAWYLLPEIDKERENCCDDIVLRNNKNPIQYIKALAMIQEMNLSVTPANGLTGKSNQLLNRIKRLIKPRTRHTAAFRLSVIAMLLLTFGALFMAFIIADNPDVKSGERESASLQVSSNINGTSTIITDDKDGDKKKMVIVFDADTIKEITVNGKKLSREEMKEYADDIRKVQRELESSQQELERAHEELRIAHSELENARKELELAHRDEQFRYNYDLKGLNELNELNHLNELDKLNDLDKLHDMNKLNEMLKNELDMRKFHLDQLHQQMQNEEFQEKMKMAQEEAMEAIRGAKEKSMEYHSQEFREKMNKIQEEALRAIEEAQTGNNEFFNSDEFKKQMEKEHEKARKAFEEFRKNGLYRQEPPTPPSDKIEAPEVPEIPEAPEAEEQIEVPEMPEAEIEEEIERNENPETMEIEEKPEADPKSEELDNKLRELESE